MKNALACCFAAALLYCGSASADDVHAYCFILKPPVAYVSGVHNFGKDATGAKYRFFDIVNKKFGTSFTKYDVECEGVESADSVRTKRENMLQRLKLSGGRPYRVEPVQF